MKRIFWFLLLGILGTSALALAHGIDYQVAKDSSVVIKVEYEEGGAMSYADVFIYSPDDDKVEYQNGRTDKNGVFAFVPDKPGVWKIKVDDGEGHGLATEVTVGSGMAVRAEHHDHDRKNNIIGALGVILGIAGFVFYWKARNKK